MVIEVNFFNKYPQNFRYFLAKNTGFLMGRRSLETSSVEVNIIILGPWAVSPQGDIKIFSDMFVRPKGGPTSSGRVERI